MYGKLNALLRSKLAVWGVATVAIVIFCITATLAFGLRDSKKTLGESPAEKIPSIQAQVNGLQVQSASTASGSSTQLQGQEGNGMASQPAAPAASSSLPELNSGLAVSQVQANTSVAVGPASTSLSASLQPSADMDGNGGAGTNVQAGLGALGASLKLNVPLP